MSLRNQRRLLYASALASAAFAMFSLAAALWVPLVASPPDVGLPSRAYAPQRPANLGDSIRVSLSDFEFALDRRFRSDEGEGTDGFALPSNQSTSMQRLVGTMIEEGQSIAVLMTEEGTQARRVGDMAGPSENGLRVVEIAATSVTLQNANGRVVLTLDDEEPIR